ncbi:galactose-1-phosphate uridylyltransferase [Phakopsora pachyrhizi]|nr:galactose-1-phosphate uridylyltransferase [Phakopsora pachyrhizi]
MKNVLLKQVQVNITFQNDFAAVNETEVKYDEPKQPNPLNSFLRRIEPVRGKCYVICFHPRHDLTMADLEPEQILSIIKTWTELYKKIPIDYPFIKYIKIFENKGSMMGCSNPHPHGQIWALSHIPTIPSKIIESQEDFANSDTAVPGHARMEDGRPSLLLAYAQSELNPIPSQRVIHQNKCFVALVPFWAVWPFEVIILPYKRHYPSLAHLQEDDQLDLANIIAHVTSTYDKLFQCSFPYSMAINQAPVNTSASAAQLHLSFSPPLLRSATVRKFLVGFELFGEAQRDLTPELAAERLRSAALNPHCKSSSSS